MLVTCTNCQSKIKVPDAAAGKKGKCPKCGTIIAIPALDAVDEPAPAPAEAPAGGSPFDFDAPPPAPVKKGRKPADEEVDDDVIGADDDEEGSRPAKKPEAKGLSLASMICGIVSVVFGTVGVCCCAFIPFVGPIANLAVVFLTAVAAVVLGFMGKSKGARGFALTGIILGFISLGLILIGVIVVIVVFGANILIAGAGGVQR